MTGDGGFRLIRGRRAGYRFSGQVPGDKSISHRAVLISLLAAGESRIEGLGTGRDVAASLAAAGAFGANVAAAGPGSVTIVSPGLDRLSEPEDVITAENSGTTARLLMGVAAAAGRLCVITGDASLRRRPMDRVALPLGKLGARLWGREGGRLLPVTVLPARLAGAEVATGVASAQVKSALLLAALAAHGTTVVAEPQPTRDHTERMLAAAGVRLEVTAAADGTVAIRLEGGQRPAPRHWRVPGDPSSAAFHLAAAALLGGTVRIGGVAVNPGRTGFLDILGRMGLGVERLAPREQDGEPVADLALAVPAGGAPLRAVRVGGDEVPAAVDELTLVGLLAACAEGRTEVRGARELRVKESDRIACLVEGLTAMGVPCGEYADGFWVQGPATLRPARLDPRGDHRMAMGFALLAMRADGESAIAEQGAAAVSYPRFWQDVLAAAGD